MLLYLKYYVHNVSLWLFLSPFPPRDDSIETENKSTARVLLGEITELVNITI